MNRAEKWIGVFGLFLIGNLSTGSGLINRAEENSYRFLMEAAEARLIDAEEGKLARERGTTEEIRSYGRWMMRDQAKLLEELRKLGNKKNIELPGKISSERLKVLEELRTQTGKNFDEKFMKMISVDHKRDVHEFKKAAKSKDEEIKSFASRYLPTIEAHLERILEIKNDE
jgi:putative membrane protein